MQADYGQRRDIVQIKFLKGTEVAMTVDRYWLEDRKSRYQTDVLSSCAALARAVSARESSPGRKENYTVKEGAHYALHYGATLYIHLECFQSFEGPFEMLAYEDEIERRYWRAVRITDLWNGEAMPREVTVCEDTYCRYEPTDLGRKLLALGEELAQVKSFPVMTVREIEKMYDDLPRLAAIFAAAAKE